MTIEATKAALASLLGPDNVLSDEASRQLAGSDFFPWPDRVLPDLVIRPGSTEETSAAMRTLTEAGHAVVPRGGGLSYTGGAVPHRPGVVADMSRLDFIDVRPDDLCAVVGAGCVWQKLVEALTPLGLKTVINPPTSGVHSMVGGAISQNLPGGTDGIVGLTIVLADGSVVRTGSWALPHSRPFWRHHGPDLTGIFVGDCGALGVKTEIALRLEAIKPAEFLSFTFPDSTALMAALLPIQRKGLASRSVILDRGLSETAGQVGVGEAARTVAAVVSQAGSLRQAIRDVAGLGRMRSEVKRQSWALHFTVESVTEAGAKGQVEEIRSICSKDSTEIDPAFPKAMRARPFTIRGGLGPKGERWVPVHGILSLSQAEPCVKAIEARLEARASELETAGIRVSWLMSTLGPYLLIEPMIYWRDELGPVHRQYFSESQLQRYGLYPLNEAARETVLSLRRDLRDTMDGFGAVHVQIGRFYKLAEALDEGSLAFLKRIKSVLDPQNRMNPGSLGLG